MMIKMPYFLRRIIIALLLLLCVAYFAEQYLGITLTGLPDKINETMFIVGLIFVFLMIMPTIDEVREYRDSKRK